MVESDSLSWFVEDLRYDLINFNLLKLRSQGAEVTGKVKNIWYAIEILE